jgi:hypothetical protein
MKSRPKMYHEKWHTTYLKKIFEAWFLGYLKCHDFSRCYTGQRGCSFKLRYNEKFSLFLMTMKNQVTLSTFWKRGIHMVVWKIHYKFLIPNIMDHNSLIRKKSDTTQFLRVTTDPTYNLTTGKLSVQYALFTYVSICSFWFFNFEY